MNSIDHFSAPIGTFLDRFIKSNQAQFSYASGELTQLLRDIGLAAKIINRETNRAGLAELSKELGETNVQGEQQKVLDMVAHVRFVRALTNGGQTCGIVSEETDGIIMTGNRHAKYVVTMDPLDGSANTAVNIPVGTIFSIYHRISKIGTDPVKEDFLQPGKEQVAAGYVIYGSSTMLVYSTGHGVNGFTLEPAYGEFLLSHANMTIPHGGKTLSVNESNSQTFQPEIQRFIRHCKERQFKTYYIGSLIADIHRNMITGGIYLYPGSAHYPNGKLRLLYECNPIAAIVEQAGGAASDGTGRILDKKPQDLHERSPLIIGSKELLDKIEGIVYTKR